MRKRITVTQHDSDLIVWLVKYFRENASFSKFPAYQNVDELAEKFKLVPKAPKEEV